MRLSLNLAIALGASAALALPIEAQARATSPQAVMEAAPYKLRLDAPCASTLTIEGASGQNAPAILDPSSDDSPSGLSLSVSGNDAVLTGERCESPATLHVAPGTAIEATMRGYGALHISGVNGPVSLDQGGSNTVTLDQATALILNTHGYGSFKLGWLNGPAILVSGGSGTVTIGRIDAPEVKATLSGYGSTTIQAGTIDTLDARLSGSGHLRFDGTVRDADLVASGYGGISLNNVTGEMHQEAHSPATISVQRSTSRRRMAATTHPILSLPDGTVITAHSLIRPDGTVVSFDDGDDADDNVPAHRSHHRLIWALAYMAVFYIVYRQRVRLSGLFMGLMRRTGRAFDPSAPCDNTEIVDLRARLSRLDARLGAVEQCVTSRDFHLHRQFHDLARRHG
ncbi:DUF2807 domain-containing protein [Asaia krungthepensis]|uniref:Putative auto-transporter adhesin head GIN domain-containing protein n=1 Tax=Asaia krungthepensis NRIC 0535 TaxID=1307925 RepID=A0ABQ0Q0M0_9PROT|nr:DUF2807 domain-containing protein [Asaia krungthepensis]GBQ86211.1 hypothetical protein AA0535_0962 [Asaia krungthepensis NRIC 0535]